METNKNNLIHYFENRILGSNSVFEPTVSIFNKGIVLNYKKVGTRFLRLISSGDKILEETDNKQVDFQFRYDSFYEGDGLLESPIQYGINNYYIYAPWHAENSLLKSTYKIWKNDNSFLTDNSSKNYTDFFFNNEKDIIFIVRNPIERFFSGIIQVLLAYPESLPYDEAERTRLKFFTGLSDQDLKYVIKNISNLKENDEVPQKIIDDVSKIFWYLMNHKWDLVLQDIHTENYLVNFKELLVNVSDSKKIKVLDLSELSTNRSLEYFSYLRNDNKLDSIYKNLNNAIDTNKVLYNRIINEIIKNEYDFFSFDNYIKREYKLYLEFIKSPYYVDLKD